MVGRGGGQPQGEHQLGLVLLQAAKVEHFGEVFIKIIDLVICISSWLIKAGQSHKMSESERNYNRVARTYQQMMVNKY